MIDSVVADKIIIVIVEETTSSIPMIHAHRQEVAPGVATSRINALVVADTNAAHPMAAQEVKTTITIKTRARHAARMRISARSATDHVMAVVAVTNVRVLEVTETRSGWAISII